MAKRKRDVADSGVSLKAARTQKEQVLSIPKPARRGEVLASKSKDEAARLPVNGKVNGAAKEASTSISGSSDMTTVQVITGSYERVLHGFTAAFPQSLVTRQEATKETEEPKVSFADNFLFNAHASAIRCLALSPLSDESSKVTLATGATDERINLYSLSTAPSKPSKSKPTLPTLHGNTISENSRNKELGSLLHHSSSITALYFPTRSKLLSSAEDSTIAIVRTRDWTPLSTIKAPIPTPQGRPSGDTAAPGEVPSGINDFAVHPSMKLMVSVSKGEKSMRLWNLVTGKKAGVLNFGREILTAVGEGRFGTGEGRKVAWDKEGEEFAVAFERGVAVFGIDCKAKGKVEPTPRTKLHQMKYLSSDSSSNILAVSTEDGRLLFYDTSSTTPLSESNKDDIPPCALVAQLGGPAAGITQRIKDFEVLSVDIGFLIVTGSSDGTVRPWFIQHTDLDSPKRTANPEEGFTAKQIGKPIGTYSTNSRITCLKAFIMTGKAEDAEEEEEVVVEDKSDDSSSGSDSNSE
ncbi:WD40-repeat-containing domain protein [Lophiotrema nucula]|uniref:WD40-repeat-containing domain protein n=1 Tax=Lophiotrema nucula TaxID=690887 RepID=A0A6A5YWX3_9PLEO|nr:WD40-repeat-containing domain protein [Lophiotrema nucula]